MSYDRIGNWRIRENGQRKKSLFQKVEEIKSDIKDMLPEIQGPELITMMCHCRRYYEGKLHYGRKDSKNKKPRDLTPAERLIYDYLLKVNLNPSTTYRWFLATRLPADVKSQLQKGIIGQNVAMKIAANRRRVKECNQGLLIIEEIRNAVRFM